MTRPSIRLGAAVGALTALPLIALFYLGDAFASLPFVPFVLFDWLARVLPGDVITIGIDGIVRTISLLGLSDTSQAAKAIEQIMALGFVVAIGGLLGALVAWGARRVAALSAPRWGMVAGALALALSWMATEVVGWRGDPALGVLWMAGLWLGWGALLGSALGSRALARPATTDAAQMDRRDALTRLAGGSLALAVGAWGVGRMLGGAGSSSGAGQALPAAPPPAANNVLGEVAQPGSLPTPIPEGSGTPPRPLPEATAVEVTGDRLMPAPGTRPELTSNEDFYRIDINTRPPVLRQAEWQLEVGGLVDNPQSLTLDDFLAMEPVTQTLTMGCISNRIAGDLIGTSQWTGVRMRDMVERWGVQPAARALYVEAGDGFFETVMLDDLMDPRAMLVYAMNGETLPTEHGFPLRIYLPNRYGMKQPKWITRIEAVDEWEAGYWVVRGWSREAFVRTVSVIDAIATDQPNPDGTIPVGGIAWAGARGIQRVEVQVDGGAWQEAQLRMPPLSELTWLLWRYDWPAEPGPHTLRVRATDGNGDLQIEERAGVRPDGATGYHERTVTI